MTDTGGGSSDGPARDPAAASGAGGSSDRPARDPAAASGAGGSSDRPARDPAAASGGGGSSDRPARDAAADQIEALTGAVAMHVRELRTARGWSLDELAGRSGVSKGMLVQIEGARTNPSVGTLARIGEAFGVTVARLLEPAADRTVRVSTAEQAPVLWQGTGGGFGRLLSGVNEPDFVELWEWRLGPGDAYRSSHHAPGTREVMHVLTGTLIVTVDGRDHRVPTGCTIDFRGDRPHGYRPEGDEPVRVMLVVMMPPGEWDRRQTSRRRSA